jgi:DNA-binding CsgD family transcriptional regulator
MVPRHMVRVLGRSAELAAISAFVECTRQGKAAVVLEGEAGIGKTTLLQQAVDEALALGYDILHASPNEAEAKMPFTVLGDLFRSVDDVVWKSISVPAVAALKIAMEGGAPIAGSGAPRAIGLGVLSLIQALAKRQPLLIALDDAQWCDVTSWSALAFALRRIADEPVGIFVVARSSQTHSRNVAADLAAGDRPVAIQVGPLSVESLDLLLRSRLAASFSRNVLSQLHLVSGGNPFFALEIGRYVLSERVEMGADGRLGVPANLRELMLRRVRRVPSTSRRLLLLMAAVGQSDEQVLARCFDAQAEFAMAVEAASDAQLIRPTATGVRFDHPLIGSVVYAAASPEQRRQAHQQIAHAVLDRDEQARHLGLAAIHRDEELAWLLEEAARRVDVRGAPEAAAEMMARAVSLTPIENEPAAHRRTVAEADCCLRAGETARARKLLEATLPTLAPGDERAHALHLLGKAVASSANMSEAEELFTQALTEASSDAALHSAIERDLGSALMQNGRPRAALAHAANVTRASEQSGDNYLLASALAHQLSVGFLVGKGVSTKQFEWIRSMVMDADTSLGAEHPGILDPMLLCATVLKWADSFDDARSMMERLLRHLSERNDEATLAPVLFHLGELECWAGNFELAGGYATRCDDVTRMAAQHARRHLAYILLAQVSLRAGRLSEADSGALRALASAEAAGDLQFVIRALAVKGAINLLEGDASASRKAFQRADDLFHRGGYNDPGVFRFHADAIEALVALGALEDAKRRIAWLLERGESLDRAWALATGSRCLGLLLAATDDLPGSLAAMNRSLGFHSRLADPLELGRTHLAKGTVLRKARQKRQAAECFAAAVRTFESIHALGWLEKVQGEMARLGRRTTKPDELTSTELRVAQLAADGNTNAAIARMLFLSVKSVEACLTRVYQKMDVKSRTAMAAKLARAPKSRVSPDSSRPAAR